MDYLLLRTLMQVFQYAHGKNGMLSQSCDSSEIAALILEVVSNQDNYLELSAHAAQL